MRSEREITELRRHLTEGLNDKFIPDETPTIRYLAFKKIETLIAALDWVRGVPSEIDSMATKLLVSGGDNARVS